jgi:hypothetical protein
VVVVVSVVVLPFSSVVVTSVVVVDEDEAEQPTAPKARMEVRPAATMGCINVFFMVCLLQISFQEARDAWFLPYLSPKHLIGFNDKSIMSFRLPLYSNNVTTTH